MCIRDRVLVESARRRQSLKRGSDAEHTSLDPENLSIENLGEDILCLDAALSRLANHDERLARVVEYRFFGGLSVDETASAMELSPRTVKRDWRMARAWLHNQLAGVATLAG